VTVTYSEEVEQSSAEDISNYSLSDGISVTGAQLQSNGTQVVLETDMLTDGQMYTLTVNNVKDVSSAENTIADNSQANFTYQSSLLEEDFDDGTADGWTEGAGTWSVSSGVYTNTAQSGAGNSYSYAGDATWSDYTYEVDVTPTSGSNQWLIFRVQESGDFYLFQFGNSTLYAKEGGDYTEITSGSASFSTGTTYHFKVDVTSDVITMYVDGSEVLSTSDVTFSSGGVGFGGYESQAEFDNVVVSSKTATGLDDYHESIGVSTAATDEGSLRVRTVEGALHISLSVTQAMSQAGKISLELYDIRGAKVRTVYSGAMDAGRYSMTLSSINCAAGLYVVKLCTKHLQTAETMVVLR
jgi:hypothetical protein